MEVFASLYRTGQQLGQERCIALRGCSIIIGITHLPLRTVLFGINLSCQSEAVWASKNMKRTSASLFEVFWCVKKCLRPWTLGGVLTFYLLLWSGLNMNITKRDWFLFQKGMFDLWVILGYISPCPTAEKLQNYCQDLGVIKFMQWKSHMTKWLRIVSKYYVELNVKGREILNWKIL